MPSIFKKANIVGGGFQDASGNPLSNGWLVFSLSHDSNIAVLGGPNGMQVAAGLQVTLFLNGLGNIVPNSYLWTNDSLTPFGSYYRVNAFNFQGVQAWAFPQIFIIQPYAATIDIGTITPQIP